MEATNTNQQQAAQQAATAQQATHVPAQPAAQNLTALKKYGEDVCSKTLQRVEELQETGQLTLPSGYHAGNALKSAWLYLQDIKDKNGNNAVQTCSRESIANCLLQMTINGEHPGKHCYFIPTGGNLTFWEKYTGKLMRAKRDAGVQSVNPQVVYEGDEFTYTVDENGEYQLVKHITRLENIDITKIVAAYAVVVLKDGSRHLEVMTMAQIRKAWGQSTNKGNSIAHTNFSDQMAKRTIINRACKVILESHSEASGLFEESDSMNPPSQAEAEREQANNVNLIPEAAPAGGAAPAAGGGFEEPEDFEEIATTEAAPAKAPVSKGRACPI